MENLGIYFAVTGLVMEQVLQKQPASNPWRETPPTEPAMGAAFALNFYA